MSRLLKLASRLNFFRQGHTTKLSDEATGVPSLASLRHAASEAREEERKVETLRREAQKRVDEVLALARADELIALLPAKLRRAALLGATHYPVMCVGNFDSRKTERRECAESLNRGAHGSEDFEFFQSFELEPPWPDVLELPAKKVWDFCVDSKLEPTIGCSQPDFAIGEQSGACDKGWWVVIKL